MSETGIGRTLDILQFALQGRVIDTASVVERFHCPRQSAHRILRNLTERGWLTAWTERGRTRYAPHPNRFRA